MEEKEGGENKGKRKEEKKPLMTYRLFDIESSRGDYELENIG
jgi:hypothetical protein